MERISLSDVFWLWFAAILVAAPILIASFLLGNIELKSIIGEFNNFLLGKIEPITHEKISLSLIPTIIVLGVIELTIFAAVHDILALILGKPKLLDELKDFLDSKPLLIVLAIAAALGVTEEIIFRGFFLWLIPRFFGEHLIYALVILSSFLFAIPHLYNYKKIEWCLRLVKIVPFFVGALLFAFIFIKFGILAAFLAHFTHNFIVILQRRLYNIFTEQEV